MIKINFTKYLSKELKEAKSYEFGNGSCLKVFYKKDTYYCEIIKSKDGISLGKFKISYHQDKIEDEPTSEILENNELSFEYKNHSSLKGETEISNILESIKLLGHSLIYDDLILNIKEDKRTVSLLFLKLHSNGNIEYINGNIKLKKSLKFQQGKSIQEGRNSDAFLCKELGIPSATLSRWKKSTDWRKKVYSILKENIFD